VFIVGEEVVGDYFHPYHAALFDGNTSFTFLIPGLPQQIWKDVGDATPYVDRTYKNWRKHIEGLQVLGRKEYVNFQPAWAPQYDDRRAQPGSPYAKYVPALSKEQVLAMAEVARKYAEPVGSEGKKLIWQNTWNCWAETTTIEPTAAIGPKYPAGNYHFDMLEVVQEVFGGDTFTCDAP
jgi:hypothetical protein